MISAANIFSGLLDCALTIWFFRALIKESEHLSKLRFALAAVILLGLTMPHYLIAYSADLVLVRYLLRLIPVALFLWLGCGQSPYKSLYFSALFTNTISAVQTVLPLLEPVFEGQPVLLQTARAIIKIAAISAVSHFIPLKKIRDLRMIQVFVTATEALLILYCKQTMGLYIRGELILSTQTMLLPVVILILSLILIAVFDRVIVLSEEQKRQALLDLSRDYQYQNLQTQINAHEDVRRIYHDMKNHLLVLENMMPEKQKEYIHDIMSETDSYEELVSTGNTTLDGLLSSKISETKEKGIQFSVNVDISELSYINPIDVCAIFGNLMDNAIEATEKIPDAADRFIEIKSSRFANQIAVRVINPYVKGSVQFKEDHAIETTKPDKESHGIGLSSARRSARQYGGIVSLQTLEDYRFIATVMLPVSKDTEETIS